LEQKRVVVETVGETRGRAAWPVGEILRRLGVSRASYQRYLQEVGGERAEPRGPRHPYTRLPEEVAVVVAGALERPELSHRVLAYWLMREGRAWVSPSAVYQVLKERDLLRRRPPKPKRVKRRREEAKGADERWQSDLKYVRVPKRSGGFRNRYLLSFLDEYSRQVVHHELLWTMDGRSVSLGAQAAVDHLRADPGWKGKLPLIQTDNGSGYIAGDFEKTLSGAGLFHERITPHCPEENGKVERWHRTFGEMLEEHDLEDEAQAKAVVAEVVRRYNEERLHAALHYLTPKDYYRGDPEKLLAERHAAIAQAREHRRQINIGRRRSVLPALETRPGGTKDQVQTANEFRV
jgi:putative transposase